MATAEAVTSHHDNSSRRRPFTSWMKRLANLKGSASNGSALTITKRSQRGLHGKGKKAAVTNNNPYPISGRSFLDAAPHISTNGHLTPPSGRSISFASPSQSKTSLPLSSDGHHPPTIGNKSTAATVSTNPGTVQSEAAYSKAGTMATAGGAVSSNGVGGGEGSTFSSPDPSLKSIATTLTTMQSAAPSNLLGPGNLHGQSAPTTHPVPSHGHQSSSSNFSHQFPTTPVSAIPPHMSLHAPPGNPTTYTTATANNILTDNASVVTLASSSKRRRRNSLDTNASVRALAPSSIYGGSKESLPLSVLSANANDQASTTGHHQGRSVSVNLANAERASIYSGAPSVAPGMPSERNSYYASKQIHGDGSSIKSSLISHGRNDSVSKSLTGLAAADSPLGSPRDAPASEKTSIRISGKSEHAPGDVTPKNEDDRASLKKMGETG